MLGRTFGTHRFWLFTLALAALTGCQQSNADETQAAGKSAETSASSVPWVTDCTLDYQNSSTGIDAATFHDESASGDSLNVNAPIGDPAKLPYAGYVQIGRPGPGLAASATAFIRSSDKLVAESDLSFELGGGISLEVHSDPEPFEYQGQTYNVVILLCNVFPKTP
jgi:hypothetical protein